MKMGSSRYFTTSVKGKKKLKTDLDVVFFPWSNPRGITELSRVRASALGEYLLAAQSMPKTWTDDDGDTGRLFIELHRKRCDLSRKWPSGVEPSCTCTPLVLYPGAQA